MEVKQTFEDYINDMLAKDPTITDDTKFFLEKLLDKYQKKDTKLKLNQDIIKTLNYENIIYNEFKEMIGLMTTTTYDNLSKYNKDQIDKLCEIGYILKLRDMLDDTFMSEYINLQEKDETLTEEIKEKESKLYMYEKIYKILHNLEQQFITCQDEINIKSKEFVNFQTDIQDRINDILDPKSEEYTTSILKTKAALEKNGYQSDISHESLKYGYNKMMTLEADIDNLVADFGNVNDIPLSMPEALKILDQKKRRLKELEEELQNEINNQLGTDMY